MTHEFQAKGLTSSRLCCSFDPSKPFSLRLLRPQDLPIIDITNEIEETPNSPTGFHEKALIEVYERKGADIIGHICAKFDKPTYMDKTQAIKETSRQMLDRDCAMEAKPVDTGDYAVNDFTKSKWTTRNTFSSTTVTIDDALDSESDANMPDLPNRVFPKVFNVLIWLKILFFAWLFLRAVFHEATVAFEQNIITDLRGWPSTIRQWTCVECTTPETKQPITWSGTLSETITDPVYDGPITIRDYIDYFLGWRGPNGIWE